MHLLNFYYHMVHEFLHRLQKLEEYTDKEEYLEDSNLESGKTLKNFPKGLVLSFVSNKNGETKL